MMYGVPLFLALLLWGIAALAILLVYVCQLNIAFSLVSTRHEEKRPAASRAFVLFGLVFAAALYLDIRLVHNFREFADELQRKRAEVEHDHRRLSQAINSGDAAAIEKAIASFPGPDAGGMGTEDLLRVYLTNVPQARYEFLRQLDERFNFDPTHYLLDDQLRGLLSERIHDAAQPLRVRQLLIRIWLTTDQQERATLLAAIRSLDPSITVAPLGEAVEHHARRFPYAPPTDIVDHLAAMGPAANDALPFLHDVLDHSNQWDFVPHVVRAIAAIARQDAMETLRTLATSDRPEIREAAERAITELKSDVTLKDNR